MNQISKRLNMSFIADDENEVNRGSDFKLFSQQKSYLYIC